MFQPGTSIPNALPRTWILLAHRSGARLLTTPGNGSRFAVLKEIAYPEGRRQNREIDTDSKGVHFSSSARGGRPGGGVPGSSAQQRHGYDPVVEAAEHTAEVFAHQLVHLLRDGRTRNEYDELILIAEPGFLGKLRSLMDKETSKRVVCTVNHNFTDLSKNELHEKLEEIVRSTRKVA